MVNFGKTSEYSPNQTTYDFDVQVGKNVLDLAALKIPLFNSSGVGANGRQSSDQRCYQWQSDKGGLEKVHGGVVGW